MKDETPEDDKQSEGEGEGERSIERSSPATPEPIRAMISSVFGQRPVFPPFMDKINEDHISKVLDYSDKQDQRDFSDAASQRRYDFAKLITICVVSLFIFVFLTVYLVDKDKELYKDILKIALGFVTGTLAGYGLGVRKKAKEDEE